MALNVRKTSGLPNDATVLADGDYLNLSKKISPGVYESQKYDVVNLNTILDADRTDIDALIVDVNAAEAAATALTVRTDALEVSSDILLDFKVWDPTRTYANNENTFYLGILYRSLQNTNLNKTPSSQPLWWESSASATIADDSVTNAKLANMAQATIKGRASGAGTGDPVDLTADQLISIATTATLGVKITNEKNAASTPSGNTVTISAMDVDEIRFFRKKRTVALTSGADTITTPATGTFDVYFRTGATAAGAVTFTPTLTNTFGSAQFDIAASANILVATHSSGSPFPVMAILIRRVT